jgi:hypothetical protein
MNVQHDGPELLELDQRSGDGIVVTLLWSQPSGSVFVSILDTSTGTEVRFGVAPTDALDAFHHPHAYEWLGTTGA